MISIRSSTKNGLNLSGSCGKWGTVKSSIINSDTHVFKKTISRILGAALPSGTDVNVFLVRLIYNFHSEKMKGKVPLLSNKAVDITSDINEGNATDQSGEEEEDDEDDKMGGLVAK